MKASGVPARCKKLNEFAMLTNRKAAAGDESKRGEWLKSKLLGNTR